MQTSVLITNGGSHPAEKWAEATAAQLIRIGESASPEALTGGRKLEVAIIDILEGHHRSNQSGEVAKLEEHGPDRYVHDIDPNEHVDIVAVAQSIFDAAKGTQFSTHFERPEVQQYVRDVLASHFATAQDVERQWHADRSA